MLRHQAILAGEMKPTKEDIKRYKLTEEDLLEIKRKLRKKTTTVTTKKK